MVIVVSRYTSGEGKSTVALELAAAMGDGCLLLDAHPDQVTVKWADALSAVEPLSCSTLAFAGLAIDRAIERAAPRYAEIVVETPPIYFNPEQGLRALMVADIAIVPIGPDGEHLKRRQSILELLVDVNAARYSARSAPLRVVGVAWGVRRRSDFALEARGVIEGLGIRAADTMIYECEGQEDAVRGGRGVGRSGTPGKVAPMAVHALANELRELMGS